jgi:OmpA-OmpF porin, OOP family
LKPNGVASLSPVTSNDTEDGKAKNRRVELVKQ